MPVLYTFLESTRKIIGQRTQKAYSVGDRIKVLVDRIDPVQRKIQFAVMDVEPVRKGEPQKKVTVAQRIS